MNDCNNEPLPSPLLPPPRVDDPIVSRCRGFHEIHGSSEQASHVLMPKVVARSVEVAATHVLGSLSFQRGGAKAQPLCACRRA